MEKKILIIISIIFAICLALGGIGLYLMNNKRLESENNNGSSINRIDSSENNSTSLQENNDSNKPDSNINKSDREKFLLSFYNDVSNIKKNNSLSNITKVTSIYKVYQKAIYSLFNDVEKENKIYTPDNIIIDIDKIHCVEDDGTYQSNGNYYICDEGAYSISKDFSKIESNNEGLPLYLTPSSKNDLDIYDLAYQELYQYIIKQKLKEYNADAKYVVSKTNGTDPCVDYNYTSGNNYIDINMYSSIQGWYDFNVLSGKCENTIKKYYTYKINLDNYSYVRTAH